MSIANFIKYMQNNPDKVNLPIMGDLLVWRMVEETHNNNQYVVNEGGRGAGKTYFNRLINRLDKNSMKQQFVLFNEERSRAGEPVMMKNGTPIVRVLAYDMKTPGYPILATYYNDRGIEVAESFTKKGEYNLHGSCGDGGMDLVMAPIVVEKWVNVYRNSDGSLVTGLNLWPSQYEAERNAGADSSASYTGEYLGQFAISITIQPKEYGE